jgi:hypothetical protein
VLVLEFATYLVMEATHASIYRLADVEDFTRIFERRARPARDPAARGREPGRVRRCAGRVRGRPAKLRNQVHFHRQPVKVNLVP